MWKQKFTLEGLNNLGSNNLVGHLDITFTDYGPDYLEATMPILDHHKQPMGLLHGGASATLAETLGSVASVLCLDGVDQQAVGVELNINHLKSARGGHVVGRATPIKVGRKIHVWNIEISNANNELVSVSRLTTMIIGAQ